MIRANRQIAMPRGATPGRYGSYMFGVPQTRGTAILTRFGPCATRARRTAPPGRLIIGSQAIGGKEDTNVKIR